MVRSDECVSYAGLSMFYRTYEKVYEYDKDDTVM